MVSAPTALQLAVVYTGTGLYKTGDTWREHGSAIYYTVANPLNRHFDAGSSSRGFTRGSCDP